MTTFGQKQVTRGKLGHQPWDKEKDGVAGDVNLTLIGQKRGGSGKSSLNPGE